MEEVAVNGVEIKKLERRVTALELAQSKTKPASRPTGKSRLLSCIEESMADEDVSFFQLDKKILAYHLKEQRLVHNNEQVDEFAHCIAALYYLDMAEMPTHFIFRKAKPDEPEDESIVVVLDKKDMDQECVKRIEEEVVKRNPPTPDEFPGYQDFTIDELRETITKGLNKPDIHSVQVTKENVRIALKNSHPNENLQLDDPTLLKWAMELSQLYGAKLEAEPDHFLFVKEK